jgi:hypothetical protein
MVRRTLPLLVFAVLVTAEGRARAQAAHRAGAVEHLIPNLTASAGVGFEGRALLYGGVAAGYVLAGDGHGGVPGPSDPRPVWRRWYGWQALAFDVTAGLAGYRAFQAQDSLTVDMVRDAAPLIYVSAAPTIHAAHHHYARAGVSLALRTLLPLLGLSMRGGSCTQSCDTLSNALTRGYAPALIGVGLAALIDDFALTWD